MPITKDVTGSIVYTRKQDLWSSDFTGVFSDLDLAIAADQNPTKQIKFNSDPMPVDSSVLIQAGSAQSGSITINLPSISGDLATMQGIVNTVTGTTYTILSSDIGDILVFTNSSPITVTLPNNFAVGSNFIAIQLGTGQITFTAQSGGTIVNRLSLTKTSGQYAAVSLVVTGNSGGSAAQWLLAGDTGA